MPTEDDIEYRLPHRLSWRLVAEGAAWGVIPAVLSFRMVPSHPPFRSLYFLIHLVVVMLAGAAIFVGVRRLQYRLRSHLRNTKRGG
jgi:hypothetical protein